MDDNEAITDEPLGIPEALREIWDQLTTSQKLYAVTPEQAKAYRKVKEVDGKLDVVFNHLQDVSREVRELKQMELDKKEKQQKREAAVKRGVMQIFKAFWPD